ncbi:hypothetical protein DICA2_C10176 [Diutina catenulata]
MDSLIYSPSDAVARMYVLGTFGLKSTAKGTGARTRRREAMATDVPVVCTEAASLITSGTVGIRYSAQVLSGIVIAYRLQVARVLEDAQFAARSVRFQPVVSRPRAQKRAHSQTAGPSQYLPDDPEFNIFFGYMSKVAFRSGAQLSSSEAVSSAEHHSGWNTDDERTSILSGRPSTGSFTDVSVEIDFDIDNYDVVDGQEPPLQPDQLALLNEIPPLEAVADAAPEPVQEAADPHFQQSNTISDVVFEEPRASKRIKLHVDSRVSLPPSAFDTYGANYLEMVQTGRARLEARANGPMARLKSIINKALLAAPYRSEQLNALVGDPSQISHTLTQLLEASNREDQETGMADEGLPPQSRSQNHFDPLPELSLSEGQVVAYSNPPHDFDLEQIVEEYDNWADNDPSDFTSFSHSEQLRQFTDVIDAKFEATQCSCMSFAAMFPSGHGDGVNRYNAASSFVALLELASSQPAPYRVSATSQGLNKPGGVFVTKMGTNPEESTGTNPEESTQRLP